MRPLRHDRDGEVESLRHNYLGRGAIKASYLRANAFRMHPFKGSRHLRERYRQQKRQFAGLSQTAGSSEQRATILFTSGLLPLLLSASPRPLPSPSPLLALPPERKDPVESGGINRREFIARPYDRRCASELTIRSNVTGNRAVQFRGE